jgi:hypothetical protein
VYGSNPVRECPKRLKALPNEPGEDDRALIHTVLEDALRLDLVARNVADLVRPPKAPHLDMQTYTPEQAN